MAFKGDDSTFSLATTVTLVLAVAAMVFVKEPLKSSRPTGNGVGLEGAASELKARARLWEDPFAAVQKDQASRKQVSVTLQKAGKVTLSVTAVGRNEEEGLSKLQAKINETAKQNGIVTALVVMTGGGSSVEDSEARIRDRYAVGAALEVGCFVPEQTQSLSYFTWSFGVGKVEPKVPVTTPYEWYKRSVIASCRAFDEEMSKEKARHVLVLWVAAEETEQTIFARVKQLLSKFRPPNVESSIPAKLVGPRSSSEFRSMLQEIEEESKSSDRAKGRQKAGDSPPKVQEPIALYSPWATAMPGLLSYGLNSGSQKNGVGCQSYGACKKVFTELLSDAGLLLKYSIDSDQVLFESLFEELNRRRVTVGADSIALIGEWDSFYARSLPLTFSAAACRYITDEKVAKAHPLSDALTGQLKGKCATTEQGIDQFKTGAISPRTLNIRQYSYLSGLDGEASVDQGSPSRLKGDDKDKEKGEAGKAKLRDIASYERPEGPSQLDYVRRLVARMKTEDQENDKAGTRGEAEQQGKKVKAVGILGRDAYDALLILQAVREQFPNALFFATDLDARYSHEDELKWTRNLIVVSHFGLRLQPSLQQAIPPFRHSLQTSTFLAVLRAIDHVGYRLDQSAGPNAQLAEYVMNGGQQQQIEYSTVIRPRLFEIGRHGAVDLSVDNSTDKVRSVHPARQDVESWAVTFRMPERIGPVWIAVTVLGFLTAWGYGRFWNWLTARDERDRSSRNFKRVLRPAWVPLLILGVVLLWCKLRHFSYVEDEPFSWSDGVSVWPTELLRLFATLLSLSFLMKACADLAVNTEDLTKKFFPQGASAGVEEGRPRNLQGFWTNLDWMFHGSKRDRTGEARTLWARYCRAHTWPQRTVRIALWLLLYLMMVLPVWRFMNDGEWRLYVPCRGEFSCHADAVLTSLSVFSLIILNLAVLDAVILCTKWIQEMPSATGLDPIRQVRLIIERTRVVNRRILYPFLSLFLLIGARSHYFDNWDFPPALILVLTVNSLVALASACMLYLAAVEAKRKVLAPLQQDLDRVLIQQECAEPAVDTGPSSDHLRQIISEIDAVQQGAFVPFYQQPVVQATLVAVLAFLQYWYLGQ